MMIKKIEQTIKKYSMLNDGETVIVGLSGGADSCALLLSLLRFTETNSLKIIIAHFNHGLRHEESDRDEEFCRNLAHQFGLTFVAEKMRQQPIPKGMSPEDFFRRERYRFLDKVATDHEANKIALGHHLQDQAETVLINILRGSGLDGLKGFLPVREGKYIRPLMEVSRQDIYDFLKDAGMDYCHDSSNESKVYLRNRVRMELIPYLKEKYNPRIEQSLVRMADIIRRDDSCLNGYVNEISASPHIQKKKNTVSFSVEYFKALPASLGFRLLKALLEGLVPNSQGFSFSHIQLLANLAINNSSGKRISLPHGFQAQKQYDRIMIESGQIRKIPDYEYPIVIPDTIDLKERRIILSTKQGTAADVDFKCGNRIYFDLDKIKQPLMIRNRRSGDWFNPLGMQGKQKIKKLFIDHKIPRPLRDVMALLVDQKSVIWIEDMHLSERIKVSSETKNILILEILPAS